MRSLCELVVGLVAATAVPATAQPALPLARGSVQGSVTLEVDASAGQFGDTISIAPDVAVGINDDLTLAIIHSTYGRTGFRGAAGGGICVTDACASTYDNAGIEALYSLLRGTTALAANAGVHATSFDRDLYVAKLGAKARHKIGRVTLAALPSITIAVTERDAMAPNRDRLWLPISAMIAIAGGFSAGASTGLKAPLDDTFDDSYEVTAGLLGTYTVSPALSFGASWVYGKLFAGDLARPAGVDGLDLRALQLWVTGSY